jgi:uncharacterized coiled-coil DUF342 family protein
MSNVEDTGWVVAGVLAVVSTLASAVAFLAKMVESKNTDAIVELRKEVDEVKGDHVRCEEKYEAVRREAESAKVELAQVRAEVGYLRTQINP